WMPNSSICITYSNPQGVFYPGTNVDGVVQLELKESIKARSLRITVDGRAHTHWKEHRWVSNFEQLIDRSSAMHQEL
ncbi:hypothetical protein OSTOST_17679, partial [Ostertagia ostertagi]